jgi:hypothetical protein
MRLLVSSLLFGLLALLAMPSYAQNPSLESYGYPKLSSSPATPPYTSSQCIPLIPNATAGSMQCIPGNYIQSPSGGLSRNMTTGATDTLLSTDCNKTVYYDNAAYNVTVPSSIVPPSGNTCEIDIITLTANKVTLSGSGLTIVSADGYTGTQAVAGSGIALLLSTVNGSSSAVIFGHGS